MAASIRPQLKRFVGALALYVLLGTGVAAANPLSTVADQNAWRREYNNNPQAHAIGERMRQRFYGILQSALDKHWVALTLSGWVVETRTLPKERRKDLRMALRAENKDRKLLYHLLSQDPFLSNPQTAADIQNTFVEQWLRAAADNAWLVVRGDGHMEIMGKLP